MAFMSKMTDLQAVVDGFGVLCPIPDLLTRLVDDMGSFVTIKRTVIRSVLSIRCVPSCAGSLLSIC